MLNSFKKSLIRLFNSEDNFYLYSFIFFIIIFSAFLELTDRLTLSPLAITTGDVPSYLLFPFFPIEEAFSSHRTFGFSLLLQGYQLLDTNLETLPLALYITYVTSLLFLYFSILKLTRKQIIPFIICIGLLPNSSFISGLPSLTAATLVSILMILIFAYLFRLFRDNDYKSVSLLTLLIMLLYQTRPNLSPILILMPIWLFLMNYYVREISFKISWSISSKTLISGFAVLSIFVFTRFIYVGEIGLNSFSGTVLTGQATSYLDSENINRMQGTNKIISQNILERKAKISPPCNKIKQDLTNDDRHYCGNIWIMSAWIEAIKYHDKVEPFNEAKKNLEPWLYGQLSSFFSRNNLEIDNTLSTFSQQLIKEEKTLVISRMLFEYRYASQEFFRMFTKDPLYIASLIFLLLTWIQRKVFYNNSSENRKLLIHREFKLALVLLFVAISFMLQGIIIPAALLHLDYRYISASSIFFLPPILVFAIFPLLKLDK